jgi:hypothetical protein
MFEIGGLETSITRAAMLNVALRDLAYVSS